jgi:hypothetical protein
MVHIAMADAVLAIDGKYEPFHARLNAPRGADPRAAAAQAGHDVLVAMLPANAAIFVEALEATLKTIPRSRHWPGRSFGARVAASILAWREFDGYADANPQPPPLLPSELPGIWQQTGSGPALYADLGNAWPFALLTATQFLPVPAPQIDSAAYAEDFNDVKSVGSAASTARTAEQTRLSQLIAGAPGPNANATNPLRVWHNVVADVARSQSLSLVDTARLYALVMVAIHDSLQTSHTSKFVYRLWRPVTAVTGADIDDNDETLADSSWTPLLFTPPYPSHASNAACIGTGAARTLANVLGNDMIPFRATWYRDEDSGDVVHSEPYASFSAFARDFGSSRIWGGIHFRFEIDASEHSCTQVADYVFDHYMLRKTNR